MTAPAVAIVLGLLVGLSLGALGGGGSTLAVPILVFVGGMGAQSATAASLLVVGVAAAIGVVGHVRNGNVRLGAGIAFGTAGIVGSRLGTAANRSLDENVLLLAFSVLVLVVAVHMYRSVDSGGDHVDARSVRAERRVPVGPDDESAGTEFASTPPSSASGSKLQLSPGALLKLAGAATAVGVLTGLFGVGGGFAVVPALTLLLGFEAREAIGTSLVVIAINAAIALGMRWGDFGFDWGLVLPFLTTVTVGVLLGSVIANRIEPDRLTRSFSIMLAVVAAYTAADTALA